MRKFGKINLAVFYVNLKEFLHHDKAHDHSASITSTAPERRTPVSPRT